MSYEVAAMVLTSRNSSAIRFVGLSHEPNSLGSLSRHQQTSGGRLRLWAVREFDECRYGK
jgi:hypothetical protein